MMANFFTRRMLVEILPIEPEALSHLGKRDTQNSYAKKPI